MSEQARKRILSAALQLKYRPNHSARSLTTSRSYLIGVAITHLDNQFYPQVVQLLSERLAARGYRIVLFMTHGEQDMDPMLDEILSYRVDGIILASSSLSANVAVECREANVPTIMFNNIDPKGQVTGVATDNLRGAATVAAYLIAAGHQRFGMITGLEESSTSIERCSGFAQAVIAAGFGAPAAAPGGYSFSGAAEAMRRLLSRANPPDAIFCANDHMALAALQVAQSEFDRNPGDDLSIIGFDNVAIADWAAFGLTTYEQPVSEMVDIAIAYLASAMAGQKDANSLHTLGGELIVRRSARRAPGILTDARNREVWRLPARP